MMNPSSSGWIRKYFSLYEDFDSLKKDYDFSLDREEILYGYLQPTGIMYGFPTNFLFVKEQHFTKWSGEEKFKVLLLEALLVTEWVYTGELKTQTIEYHIEKFVSFYEQTAIEKAKRNWLSFKGSNTYEKLESILDQRIDIKMKLSSGLWTAYLNNSLVFQDLIFYQEYLKSENVEQIAENRFEMMMDMLKVVSVAAHADGEIAEEEEALFEILMASSRLSKDDKKEVESFWKNNQSLNDIKFNYEMSWLMKRYFMEIATLAVWSDKKVTAEEQVFLEELGNRLMLGEEEQDKSFIAIQSFVLENEEVVPFLSGKNETAHFVSGAVDKWKRILGRNRDKLAAELHQSKELVQLIAKSTRDDLTAEEKLRAKAQLKDLAKSIPAFTLFLLPGGSIVMPLVLKLIPDLVPSAFRSNQIEEIKKGESTDNSQDQEE